MKSGQGELMLSIFFFTHCSSSRCGVEVRTQPFPASKILHTLPREWGLLPAMIFMFSYLLQSVLHVLSFYFYLILTALMSLKLLFTRTWSTYSTRTIMVAHPLLYSGSFGACTISKFQSHSVTSCCSHAYIVTF